MDEPQCTTCRDTGTVCEAHPDKPWDAAGCDCSPGMPCPACCSPTAPFVPGALRGMTTAEARRMQGYQTIATTQDEDAT
jgi:hypothetical protein